MTQGAGEQGAILVRRDSRVNVTTVLGRTRGASRGSPSKLGHLEGKTGPSGGVHEDGGGGREG